MDQLIPLNNATQIVAAVDESLKDVYSAFELFEKAKVRLKNTLGEHRDSLWRGELREYSIDNGWRTGIYENSKRKIKQNAWAFIVDKTQIKSLLSIKKQGELDAQLFGDRDNRDEDLLPEITEENIFEFINGTLGKAEDLVEDALQEVFEILRPHHSYHNFKSNSEFEIGKRVCFEWYMDTSCGMCRTNYSREKELGAIDKLFHLLDGKPIPQYPSGIVIALNEACRAKKWEAETDYFILKWYKKGSLHIEFKRLDLVAEINKRAGGMRLR